MADKFEDLRTFTTIIAAGGINAAATELGIAKSAVSRRLSDLERRLGISLVERSGRRLELTAIGREYARRARAILASLDELDASLGHDGERRSVTIEASAALIRHVLTPAIAASTALVESGMLIRMSETFPDEPDVLIGLPDHRRGPGRRLISVALVLCASPEHIERHGRPGDQRDLDDHPAIAIGDEPAEWLVGDKRRSIAKVSIVTNDVDSAAAAAAAGLGLAQLPDYVVAAELGDGRLVQLLSDDAPRPVDVEARVGEGAGIDASKFVDVLADAIATIHGRRRG